MLSFVYIATTHTPSYQYCDVHARIITDTCNLMELRELGNSPWKFEELPYRSQGERGVCKDQKFGSNRTVTRLD